MLKRSPGSRLSPHCLGVLGMWGLIRAMRRAPAWGLKPKRGDKSSRSLLGDAER